MVFVRLPIYLDRFVLKRFSLAEFGLEARAIISYVFVIRDFIDSVAKCIGSLSDCRWRSESATEGLSSIARGRLVNACESGVGVGGGLLGDSQKPKARITSLDSYVSKSSVKKWFRRSSGCSGGSWSRQQKRCYQRILTFIYYNEFKSRRMAFATLTSSPESDVDSIMAHFQSLRKRLRRRGIEFEYFNVKTSEGYGVLHLLFAFTSRKGYISQKWLSKTWEEIHGAKVVFIEKYRYKTAKRLSRYFVGQYVSGQSGFERYSWSRKELSGFVKCWQFLKRWYSGRELYRVWHRFLAGQILYFRAFMVIWCVKPPPIPRVFEFKETPLDTWLFA